MTKRLQIFNETILAYQALCRVIDKSLTKTRCYGSGSNEIF